MRNNFRLVPSASSFVRFSDVINIVADDKNYDFEKKLEDYLSINYSRTFTSFMRAILGVLMYLKTKSDKKNRVLLSRFSCPTFQHAIIEAGLVPHFCDINPRNLSMNIENISDLKFEKTLALISVNHFGFANNPEKLYEFCQTNELFLIQDLGYSLGAEYKNKKIGMKSDFSVLNFKEGKAIPIGGGMVLTNDKNFEVFFSDIHNKKSRNIIHLLYPIVTNPIFYFIIFNLSRFFSINIRRTYSMEDTISNSKKESDFSLEKDKSLNQLNQKDLNVGKIFIDNFEKSRIIRNNNALRLEKLFRNYKFIHTTEKVKSINEVHHIRYPVLIHKSIIKKLTKLMISNGIEVRRIYSELKPEKKLYPGSKFVRDRILTFPTNHSLNDRDFHNIKKVLNEFQK